MNIDSSKYMPYKVRILYLDDQVHMSVCLIVGDRRVFPTYSFSVYHGGEEHVLPNR